MKSILQKVSLILADLLSLWLSLLIIIFMFDNKNNYTEIHTVGIAKIFGLFILIVFWYNEHYTKRRPIWEEILLVYRIIFVFAILHLGLTYLFSHNIIKFVNILFWLFLLLLLPTFRYIAKNVLILFNMWQRDIYIVGTSKNAFETYKLLKTNRLLGYKIIAFIDIHQKEEGSYINNILVYPYKTILQNKIANSEIFFALSSEDLILSVRLINQIQMKYKFVTIVPDISGIPLYGAELDHFYGSDQLFLRLKNNLGRLTNRFIKRFVDILLAIIALGVLLPLFIFFAVLIKLKDKNKVFYKHLRVGRNGKNFYCLKFQTMHHNSDEMLNYLLKNDINAYYEWQKDFKLKKDPRITKLGSFLRQTSLDELPQLFNVIKGDMSLVGPRPIVSREIEKYADNFYYYNMVRPGITGLWQISGRSDLDYKSRVRLDVSYVKNWSLWYDLVILFKTVFVIFRKKGAY